MSTYYLFLGVILHHIDMANMLTSVMTSQTTFAGQQHVSPPYYSGTVGNIMQCQRLCLYQPKCMSFNYSPGTKSCEMIEDLNLNLQANRNKMFVQSPLKPQDVTTAACEDHEICVRNGADPCRCFPFLELGCDAPGNVTGSDVNVTSLSIGSIASYECSLGYKYISGIKTSTCQSDKTWTNVNLICNEIDCGLPPGTNGSDVSVTSTTFNNTATYSCKVGYDDNGGEKMSFCQLDESWSIVTLNCTIRDCGWPDYLDGALANYISTSYGSVAVYTCLSGFTSTGNGTSSCLEDGQWSSISLVCTASPYRTWTSVATTTSGNTPSLQLSDLTSAIEATCARKLKLKVTSSSSTRMVSVAVYHVMNTVQRIAQALKGLSKSSWKSFKSDPERLFDKYLHNGAQTNLKVSITGQKAQTTSTGNFEWYFDDDDTSPYTSASPNLIQTISSGAIDSCEEHLHVDGTTLSSQRGSISQNANTFLDPPYWYVTKISSDDGNDVVRWYLAGGFNSISTQSNSKTWCLDDKWNLIMSSVTDDFERDRLVLHIVGGIRLGRNIVVKADNMVSPATDGYLLNGHVTVAIPEHWVPATSASFSDTSRLRWLVSSTNGVIKTCTHVPESAVVDTIEETNAETSWFLDSRIWNKALTIDKDGNVGQGSRSQLYTSVSTGTDLRVGVQYTSGLYHITSVDNVEFSNDNHIAAEMIHRPHLVESASSTFGFPLKCSIRSSIVATDGTYVQYIYDLGIGGSHVNISDVEYIEWFVEG